MADYQVDPRGNVIRTADRTAVSTDPGHRDRRAYNAWLARGNTPDQIPEPPKRPRDKRRDAYVGLNTLPGLGKDPGDVEKTLGDVLDILIAQTYVIVQHTGAPMNAEYADMLSKIQAIKLKYALA